MWTYKVTRRLAQPHGIIVYARKEFGQKKHEHDQHVHYRRISTVDLGRNTSLEQSEAEAAIRRRWKIRCGNPIDPIIIGVVVAILTDRSIDLALYLRLYRRSPKH